METISEKSKAMKLLFVYTKFLNCYGESRCYRGFKELSLNFSADSYFSYQNGILTEKKLEKPIIPNFFGDRIYNLTSFVGNNGSGKTTILQYLIKTLQQIYEGNFYVNDFIILAIEWNSKKYVLEYSGKINHKLEMFPEGFKFLSLNDKSSNELLSTTKLIYLSNTLTNSDLELVRPQLVKENGLYVNRFHYRYDFLYNCSTASLMIENCQNDSSRQFESTAEYIKCFFLYEQYKQVKYVFDKRQYNILKELRGKGYPVPIPNQLIIELQRIDYYEVLGKRFYSIIENNIRREMHLNQHRKLLFELCINCILSFSKTVKIYTETRDQKYLKKLLEEFECKNLYYTNNNIKQVFIKILNQIWSYFKSVENSNKILIESLYQNCIDFITFVFNEEKQINRYFEIDTFNEKAEKSKRIFSFSIKTTGESAEWFIAFLQKYRYTCEPYYYLNFHWGLSNGEQNLLRMFSSLYYIFDADFTNSERGDYKIYNRYNSKKISCDSIILFLDEADLTYHPEWQRRFISILVAFLPKIYPKTSCSNIQIILTTHSPLMIGDSPAQSVIYLSRNSNGQVTVDDSGSLQTFGENLYTLLQKSFSVQNGAIGELVRIKIEEMLETLKVLKEDISSWSKEKPSCNQINEYIRKLKAYKNSTIAFLADGIIKAKLSKEIDCYLQQLNEILLQYNKEFSSFSELSNTELQYQLNAISKELERRKDDLQ